MKLTPKQQRFVQEYLVDLNATQAAIRAGYSKKTAEQYGYQLLQKPSVQEAIASGRAKATEKAELSVAWVLTRLRTVAERCLQSEPVIDKKGEPVYVETPNGNETPAFTFQATAANRSLELLGKHLGMFPDKVEHTGKDGGPIETKELSNDDLAREAAFILTSAVKRQETVQ